MRRTIGIKLDEDTQNRLKHLGELKRRAPHWIMKEAILQYLDREEVVERERLEDQARWERYQATGIYVPDSSVIDWLESWGTDEERPCPKPE